MSTTRSIILKQESREIALDPTLQCTVLCDSQAIRYSSLSIRRSSDAFPDRHSSLRISDGSLPLSLSLVALRYSPSGRESEVNECPTDEQRSRLALRSFFSYGESVWIASKASTLLLAMKSRIFYGFHASQRLREKWLTGQLVQEANDTRARDIYYLPVWRMIPLSRTPLYCL